jgi:hypothetical protein
LGEEVAFDVVDDDRVVPGEKLTDGKKPLAASGWSNNKQVAKLRALFGLRDRDEVCPPPSEKEAFRRGDGGEKACRLMDFSKARPMQAVVVF